jgi:protein involved in polysaccharide export with SLBB domain
MRKLLRYFSISLLAAALLGMAWGQDATRQDTTTTQQHTQTECAAMSPADRAAAPDCTEEGPSTTPRQTPETPVLQTPQLTSGQPESPERRTVTPLNPSERQRIEERPVPKTEFQQLVKDTVGRALPVFGQSLFVQPPSTFAPTDRAQVPGSYQIGPDDELRIKVWGQINAELRAVVDRSGQVYIPHVGPITVAGVRYSDLEKTLSQEIGKVYRNFNVTASIGRIRSIQVFVVGQAHYPGTYTISSLSTLVNAVFASGGPTSQGSLRDVQVQRDGKTVAHLDFYELLVKGDKSKDIPLQTGDVICFPPVGPLVAAAGSVNAPAIYEAKPGSTLGELIEIAGGLSNMADATKITIERIGGQQHSVLELPLDDQSRTQPLADGDIVRVLSLVPRYTDAVTLRGNVVNPGRYPWKPGMRVRDLIPNAEALLTRPYWMDRASMVSGRSTEYPVVRPPEARQYRGERQRLGTSALGETREGVTSRETGQTTLDRRSASDAEIEIQDRNPDLDLLGADTTTDRTFRERGTELPWKSTDILAREEERRRLAGEKLTYDLHRISPEVNWNYAIIQRVNPADLTSKLLAFNLGKAVLENDAANNLELLPDDIITIFSQAEIAEPEAQRARYVRVEGEVVRAGVYKVEPGEQLRSVLERAGGVTPAAYIYGTEYTRESARMEQQKSIDELARTMEVQLRQAAVSAAARGSEDAQSLAAQQSSQEALISQLRNVKATGRVVLSLKPTATSIDAYPALPVEDNDRIYVPHLPATVSVVGMVYNPGSFVFNPRSRAGDYLKMAGKGKPQADMKHVFVLRADGTVVASTTVNGMFSGDKFASLRLYPGDQIVVPNKIGGNFVRGLRDWTQITSQLALTSAALAVVH